MVPIQNPPVQLGEAEVHLLAGLGPSRNVRAVLERCATTEMATRWEVCSLVIICDTGRVWKRKKRASSGGAADHSKIPPKRRACVCVTGN